MLTLTLAFGLGFVAALGTIWLVLGWIATRDDADTALQPNRQPPVG